MTVYLDMASIHAAVVKANPEIRSGSVSINSSASAPFASFNDVTGLDEGREIEAKSRRPFNYFGLTVEIVRWGYRRKQKEGRS